MGRYAAEISRNRNRLFSNAFENVPNNNLNYQLLTISYKFYPNSKINCFINDYKTLWTVSSDDGVSFFQKNNSEQSFNVINLT